MSKNLLRNTKSYLIGAMEFQNGESWRNTIKSRLDGRGIKFFDPYHKPFTHDVPEDDDSRKQMENWRLTGQYDLIESRMGHVVKDDLWLCNTCDWFIANINPTIPSWGSARELYRVIDLGKPIFISIDHPGGKKVTPYWWFGEIPHKYIYDSLDNVIQLIEGIDDGLVPMTSDKWRLLRMELR